MPKKTSIFDLKISRKPVIEVIGYNHKPDCKYPTSKAERDCRCIKYWYITAAEGERYRVSSGYVSWQDARNEARKLEVSLSPEGRTENEKKSSRVRVSPKQLFELYLQSKKNGHTQRECKHGKRGVSSVVKKIKTLMRFLVGDEKHPGGFLAQWHALPLEQRKIEPNQTLTKIEWADQITTYWLEHAWRPTWFNGNGSFWAVTKRLELISAVWHFGILNGYIEKDKHSERNCQCTACKMMKPKKQTKRLPPTPPFTPAQYAMIVDSCSLYEASYRDFNTEQLRITNKRLRAFIEVMRYCGPRIIDASLLRKDGLIALPNGKVFWSYVPVKNGDDADPIKIPVPKHVYQQLMALPDDPNLSPDYFFWSGVSLVENAPDPWQRALTRLFGLCPKEAQQVFDARNKKKVRPTSHMFRNTFCVQCRLNGMSYAQIADAIGDTEQMVKDHYSAYCEEYDLMVAAGVETMQAAVERMQHTANVEVIVPKGGSVAITSHASA